MATLPAVLPFQQYCWPLPRRSFRAPLSCSWFVILSRSEISGPVRLLCARYPLELATSWFPLFGILALPAALLAKHSTRTAPQFYPPPFVGFAGAHCLA